MLKEKIIDRIVKDNYCLDDYVIKSYRCNIIDNGNVCLKDVVLADKGIVSNLDTQVLLYHKGTNLLLFNDNSMSNKGYVKLGGRYHEVLGDVGYEALMAYEDNGETIIV